MLIRGLAPGALGSVTQQFTDGFFSAGTTVGRTSDYEAISPDLATYPFTGRGYGSITPAKSDTYRILDNQYLIELLTLRASWASPRTSSCCTRPSASPTR